MMFLLSIVFLVCLLNLYYKFLCILYDFVFKKLLVKQKRDQFAYSLLVANKSHYLKHSQILKSGMLAMLHI